MVSGGIMKILTDFVDAFCFRDVEDLNHVFFNCRFSKQVCKKKLLDAGGPYYFLGRLDHFNLVSALVKSKKWSQIWLVTIWCFWRLRNNVNND
jgi:hypothetical protein